LLASADRTKDEQRAAGQQSSRWAREWIDTKSRLWIAARSIPNGSRAPRGLLFEKGEKRDGVQRTSNEGSKGKAKEKAERDAMQQPKIEGKWLQ